MENYFKMNLPQSEIDAISNLGLAHMGTACLRFSAGATSALRGKRPWDSCTMTPFRW